MRYLIIADKPFSGHAQSALRTDGSVMYTDYKSVTEYEAGENIKTRVVGEAELNALIDEHLAGMVTKPERITRERFDEMLNILPPCRWHNADGFEVFHVSERLTYSLVSWFAHMGSRYWEFTDHDNITDELLAAKLRAA